ncbi:MAG: hypothetical protein KIS94_14050 [Chitinophagales bacterium]|nr:hypothetical protein [Chitinophagales bacterium]
MNYTNFFRYAAVLFLLVTFSAACKKEKPGNFTVNLQAYVGSQPLSFSNTIYNDGNTEFYFSKLKFFASHFTLVRADNVEVKIKDAMFFDWSDNSWKSFSADVDAGTYKGLKFYVGLDPQQNATNPDDYKSTEPLGPKTGMFWDWMKHIFVLLEGRADTLGQNFINSKALRYHTGTDTCYRAVVLTGNNIVINQGEKKSINLNVDLLKAFKEPPAPIDMFTQSETQSEGSELPLAIQFSDQFAKAFSYSE